MTHCDSDSESLKINVFKVLFLEGGGGVTKRVLRTLLIMLTIVDVTFFEGRQTLMVHQPALGARLALTQRPVLRHGLSAAKVTQQRQHRWLKTQVRFLQ